MDGCLCDLVIAKLLDAWLAMSIRPSGLHLAMTVRAMWLASLAGGGLVTGDMTDYIIINCWLARWLGKKIGTDILIY